MNGLQTRIEVNPFPNCLLFYQKMRENPMQFVTCRYKCPSQVNPCILYYQQQPSPTSKSLLVPAALLFLPSTVLHPLCSASQFFPHSLSPIPLQSSPCRKHSYLITSPLSIPAQNNPSPFHVFSCMALTNSGEKGSMSCSCLQVRACCLDSQNEDVWQTPPSMLAKQTGGLRCCTRPVLH